MKTPFKINDSGRVVDIIGNTVKVAGFALCGDEEAIYNEIQIVQRVNMHEELVSKLKKAISALEEIEFAKPENIRNLDFIENSKRLLGESL